MCDKDVREFGPTAQSAHFLKSVLEGDEGAAM